MKTLKCTILLLLFGCRSFNEKKLDLPPASSASRPAKTFKKEEWQKKLTHLLKEVERSYPEQRDDAITSMTTIIKKDPLTVTKETFLKQLSQRDVGFLITQEQLESIKQRDRKITKGLNDTPPAYFLEQVTLGDKELLLLGSFGSKLIR